MRITRLPHKLRRFGALSLADKGLLLRTMLWLLVARVQLGFSSFPALIERLAATPAAGNTEADPELLRRIGHAVSAAAGNVPWRSDCFPQAIAARKLLAGYGLASTIHLGVEKAGDGIAGHAWLTCGDTVVVGGSELDRYTEVHRVL